MSYGQSSGLKASSAIISANTSYLIGLNIVSDGTNTATVIVYDNASAASGTAVVKALIPGAVGSDYFHFAEPIICNNGIYVSISGTGAAAIVHWISG
jgi:hypothetical protein